MKRKLFEAKFINRHTGEINEILLESGNIWEVTEYCESIQIPEYYELFHLSERFE